MSHTSAYPPLPPSNSSEAEGLHRVHEEFIEEEPLTRMSSRQSSRSRTTIHSDAFSMWDDELFTIERLRTSMITETDKVPLLDHYHHGDTYVKGVRYLAPTAERRNIW